MILESEAEKERSRQKELAAASAQEVVVTMTSRVETGVSDAKLKLIQQLQAQVEQKSWAVDNPDPLAKSRVPITKAERRKLIKEELKRLGQSEEPVLWQRRMW